MTDEGLETEKHPVGGIEFHEGSLVVIAFKLVSCSLQGNKPQGDGLPEHRCYLNGKANEVVGYFSDKLRKRDASILLGCEQVVDYE